MSRRPVSPPLHVQMNHRPFNVNSTSIAASMEGLGSSTTAVRNKRGDWLTRSKSGIIVKVVVVLAVAALLSTAIILGIPIAKRAVFNGKPSALASTHHNFVKNATFGN